METKNTTTTTHARAVGRTLAQALELPLFDPIAPLLRGMEWSDLALIETKDLENVIMTSADDDESKQALLSRLNIFTKMHASKFADPSAPVANTTTVTATAEEHARIAPPPEPAIEIGLFDDPLPSPAAPAKVSKHTAPPPAPSRRAATRRRIDDLDDDDDEPEEIVVEPKKRRTAAPAGAYYPNGHYDDDDDDDESIVDDNDKARLEEKRDPGESDVLDTDDDDSDGSSDSDEDADYEPEDDIEEEEEEEDEDEIETTQAPAPIKTRNQVKRIAAATGTSPLATGKGLAGLHSAASVAKSARITEAFSVEMLKVPLGAPEDHRFNAIINSPYYTQGIKPVLMQAFAQVGAQTATTEKFKAFLMAILERKRGMLDIQKIDNYKFPSRLMTCACCNTEKPVSTHLVVTLYDDESTETTRGWNLGTNCETRIGALVYFFNTLGAVCNEFDKVCFYKKDAIDNQSSLLKADAKHRIIRKALDIVKTAVSIK